MSDQPKKEQSAQSRDLDNARQVIEIEIKGLEALKSAIDDNFTKAVDAIDAMKADHKGRLIVAGIGKSGHVGRKIAATLASTGTPTHFVHPGEASHGDLGMITEDDIVLMISNSGENAELSDLIHYTRRFNIPLIAMTSGKDSTLARHADILLLMPKAAEACPNGMAPTTSTTMTIAFGDCLAVALLDRMGLSKDDFKVFHPGGKLGQQLLKVGDIMHGEDALPLIRENATMEEAILVLSEKNLGCVLIIDDKKSLKGIITDGDLKRHMAPDLLERKATDIMSTSPKSIAENALAAEAMQMMTQNPDHYITSLIVTDEKGVLSGLIRLQDCLQNGLA